MRKWRREGKGKKKEKGKGKGKGKNQVQKQIHQDNDPEKLGSSKSVLFQEKTAPPQDPSLHNGEKGLLKHKIKENKQKV